MNAHTTLITCKEVVAGADQTSIYSWGKIQLIDLVEVQGKQCNRICVIQRISMHVSDPLINSSIFIAYFLLVFAQ